MCACLLLAMTGCGGSTEPAEGTPEETVPAESTAAESVSEETVSEETPSEETPSEEDTASEETSAEETSEEETSAEETSAEETSADAAPAEYEIASLKGPTTMGMVKMMSDSEAGLTFNKYNVTMYGAADEILAGVVSGNTDIANVPANLAAVLYNKTEGNLQVSAVNTLGVLYVVTSGEEISSIADLKGKTVYSTGKGTTPEYVLNYILRQNGLEPQTDVTIEYKTEAAECAAVMAESENAIAVLPQPYVTVAMNQNENIKIALSLTDEWDKVCDTPLITGVTIGQKSVIAENTGAYDKFLEEYAASADFVNANTDEAAALVGGYDIVPEPVAKIALPLCNIRCIRGQEMRDAVNGYWGVLFEADPASVGGTLPPADSEAFYG